MSRPLVNCLTKSYLGKTSAIPRRKYLHARTTCCGCVAHKQVMQITKSQMVNICGNRTAFTWTNRIIPTTSCMPKTWDESGQQLQSSWNGLRSKRPHTEPISRMNSGKSGDGLESVETKQTLGRIEGKSLHLAFTCKVCDTRTARAISQQAYNEGVVIVRCSGCNNNHLIADNLGWFEGAEGAGRNIEEIMAAKGEEIRTHLTDEETLEITSLDVANDPSK